MSIADYSDLFAQVSDYTGRTDFGQVFPRLVSFAETTFNRRLRVSGMETIVELITDTQGSVDLPADYLEMRELLDSTGRPLDLYAVRALDEHYQTMPGSLVGYSIVGGKLFVIPENSQSLTATYYAKVPALTPANTTNWLLEDAPLVYHYALIAHVLAWAVASGREADAGRAQAAATIAANELDAFQTEDNLKRYSNGRVLIGGVCP